MSAKPAPRRHLDAKHDTTFDRRASLGPSSTYGVLIGQIPPHERQSSIFSLARAYIKQVAD